MTKQFPDIDASALVAKAEQQASQAQDAHRAAMNDQFKAFAADAAQQPAAHGTLSFPPGFVGAFAQFIYQAAPLPVPEVAVVGALGLMAGMAGRQWTISNTGLNLYIVLVARSAIGKEAMHSGIAKLLNTAARQCPYVSHYVDFLTMPLDPPWSRLVPRAHALLVS